MLLSRPRLPLSLRPPLRCVKHSLGEEGRGVNVYMYYQCRRKLSGGRAKANA